MNLLDLFDTWWDSRVARRLAQNQEWRERDAQAEREWRQQRVQRIIDANITCPHCGKRVSDLPVEIGDLRACPHCRVIWGVSGDYITHTTSGGELM